MQCFKSIYTVTQLLSPKSYRIHTNTQNRCYGLLAIAGKYLCGIIYSNLQSSIVKWNKEYHLYDGAVNH